MKLVGVGASPGIAVGPAVVHHAAVPEVVPATTADRPAEGDRFRAAYGAVLDRLDVLAARAAEGADSEAAAIFEAHRMFLDDPSFTGAIIERIEGEGETAETATAAVSGALTEQFAAIPDPYFAARAADVQDLGSQLLRNLLGLGPATLDYLEQPSVIVADDLTPSETVTIPQGMALALVTRQGSATSHSAILARSLGIPAVIGAEIDRLSDGVTVGVDGSTGELWAEPDEGERAELDRRAADLAVVRQAQAARAHGPAVTADGVAIEVMANIGGAADAVRADEAGADGVGLFRTEFLFLDRTELPTEEEQYADYRAVFEVAGSRPVVVRTLDIGGDKHVPGLDLAPELNPFLGRRGVRLTLDEPELFRTQLRALLRAAVGGDLRLMFPMVATVAEIRRLRALVDAIDAELRADGVASVDGYQVGIMIEVPSAAVTADLLAPHVDFFSIGTNDLTQYTLAVDRMNPAVADLADALHPAVLRLVASVIDAAHGHGRWVGLCGELAGETTAVPILLGLGLDEWSVNPPAVAAVKATLATMTTSDARSLAQRVLGLESPEAVRAEADGFLLERAGPPT